MHNSLFFDVIGSSQSKTILFLHGGGSSGWSWKPIAEQLANNYRCVIADLPQHGKSQHIEPFSIPYASDCLAEIVDSLNNGEQWTLVGLSEGAQIGVELLTKHPEKFQFAILSGAMILPLPGSKWVSRGLLDWTYYWFVKPFQKSDWYIRMNMSLSVGIPGKYFPQFKKDFQQLSKSGWTNLMEANLSYRMPGSLNKVKTKSLFLCGEKEYGIMKKSAQLLAQTIPLAKAGRVKIPGKISLAQSHNWPLNYPELAVNIIQDWILQKDFIPSVEYVT